MTELERVIGCLQEIADQPAWDGTVDGIDQETIRKALVFLRLKAPARVIIEGSDMARVGRCPGCRKIAGPYGARFCWRCGKELIWDAD